MAGTASSGRPGGNPDLKNFHFQTDRPEPLTAKLTLRLPQSLMDKLKQLGNDYPEFCRQAILEKFEREESAENGDRH